MLSLSESFLWANYHLSLLCSRMDQRSLLPLIYSLAQLLTTMGSHPDDLQEPSRN